MATRTDNARCAHVSSTDCPGCRADPVHQTVVRSLRDGAFDRVDFRCERCGLEHPVWSDHVA